MPAYPIRALVLRKTKLGDSDLIITMLAADGRQVRAVAKGVRKTKSRIGGRLEPYSVVDLLLHTGRTLDVVAEVETVNAHVGVRADLDRASAASVVADLLDKVSVEGQAEPQMFEMACVTLDVLETASAEAVQTLVLAFLVKALSMHGYRPALDECAACAGSVGEDLRFSLAGGGLLCKRCFGEDSSAVHISAEGREVLRALVRARMAEVPQIELTEPVRREVQGLLIAYTRYHVPARLKALEFFEREG